MNAVGKKYTRILARSMVKHGALLFMGASLLVACQNPEPKDKASSESATATQAANTPSARSTVDLSLPALSGDGVWNVDPHTSKIEFSGTQGKTSFTGRFERFNVVVKLNPDAPQDGRIVALVDLGSANTGDLERDEALPGAEWFDVAQFPTARFTSEDITRHDDMHYTAKGELTVKGITQPLALDFTLAIDGTHATAISTLTLNRHDFNVGTGPYESDEWIAPSVNVRLAIEANQKEPKNGQ